MNVPFRKNTSVPAGKDAGSMNTNSNNDMMSSKIVTQFFIRDPDGYYLEICNCVETLTQYCLGNKDDLANYEEGIKPLSLQAASTTFNLMQRWVTKLNSEKDGLAQLYSKVKDTNGTIKEVGALLNCTPAENVDPDLLQIIIDRHSIYGDVARMKRRKTSRRSFLQQAIVQGMLSLLSSSVRNFAARPFSGLLLCLMPVSPRSECGNM
jgi:hypothetical protein